MSWSYSGDPADGGVDLVRFLLRDTDTNDQLFSNEEIQYLVDTWPNAYEAARSGAEILASKFTRQADLSRSVGDISISESFGGRAAEYRELAASLANTATRLTPPTPWVKPGTLLDTADRSDAGKTDFRLGQFDNLRAP